MSEYHKIETLYVRDEKTHKVDPSQLKNRTYSLIKSWLFTEKIDGTNIRVIWEPATISEESPPEMLRFAGKSDNAQIHPDLINWMRENVSIEKLRGIFPSMTAVIYGEGYGAGIQKGGLYSPIKKLIVFDVLVDGKWWLSWENTCDVAGKLGLDVVPFLGEMTLEEATAMVRTGFPSRLNDGQMRAEGLVGRTAEALFDKKGHRLIVKLKTKDF
jgi:RNA ligase